MSVVGFSKAALSIRSRLWAALALLAIATTAVGSVAWFALDRADRELATLHQQTLSSLARAMNLSQRSADMATSAPYLLNLNSTAQVEREGKVLVGMIDDAVDGWTMHGEDTPFEIKSSSSFDETLPEMRRAILDLIDASTRLGVAEDHVVRANDGLSDLRNRISGHMERVNDDPIERLSWLALQSMANAALGAGFAGNHIGLGEYQRAFNDQVRAAGAMRPNAAQTRMLEDILSHAQGPDGIFELRRQDLNLNLDAQNALFRIRRSASVMNALTAAYAEDVETYLTSKRSDTFTSITLAKSAILLIGAASILLALASALHISSHVTGNISRVASAMTRLASGDRKSKLPRRPNHADEIGDLFRSFRTFRANALRLDRSNSQLHQRNALLEKLFDNMTDGAVITDETGTVRFGNPNFRRILRLGAGPVQGLSMEALIRRTPFERAAREKGLCNGFRGRLELTDDDEHVVEFRVNRLPDEGRVWILTDATERRRLDERLNQIKRIEALGKVTGEVAHDFGNILSTISGNLHMLETRRDPSADKSIRRRLANAVEIGATLTERLLAFARRQQLTPERIELNGLVEGLVDLVRVGLKDDVSLAAEPADRPIHVKADPGQLESAILNLCLNANQAIEGKGLITISVRELDPQSALIDVSDDGAGMDEATLAQATEPFFSTRTDGEGTGLGLSMVYGFMKQTGGDLKIESGLGEGTSVQLIFPICGRAANDISTMPRPQRALVIEDDRRALEAIADQLEQLSFEVHRASSFEEGAMLLSQEGPFDLVSTDLQLEDGKSGWDLADTALATCRKTRVIVLSGRLPKTHPLLRRHATRITCIQKPLTGEALRSAISVERSEPGPSSPSRFGLCGGNRAGGACAGRTTLLMAPRPLIRLFVEADAPAVQSLFVRVNRQLAPDHMVDVFDAYIARSRRDEIDRIARYYGDRDGCFFVAELSAGIVGFYGLESRGPDAMELRRMYVDPSVRGCGIGRTFLAHAEEQTRQLGKARLVLSTSELQAAALSLYRSSGYKQLREEIAESQSNKTLGGGLRRFHFEKIL